MITKESMNKSEVHRDNEVHTPMAEFIAGMGWYTIPFIFVLSVLVFVHELGHFLIARLNGVGITDFSIGFGPELFGWRDSKGTRWKFCWFPLGGYVKMVGDTDPSSSPDIVHLKKLDKDMKKASLFYKTVWQRISVSIAGPVANYLFAILVFAILFMSIGQRYTLPVVDDIHPGVLLLRRVFKKETVSLLSMVPR